MLKLEDKTILFCSLSPFSLGFKIIHFCSYTMHPMYDNSDSSVQQWIAVICFTTKHFVVILNFRYLAIVFHFRLLSACVGFYAFVLLSQSSNTVWEFTTE